MDGFGVYLPRWPVTVISKMDKEERIARAVELFKSGCNCSQAIVGAFADQYGFTPEQAMRMSAAFGGGIGRMRLTCGAACGIFMLAGLEATDPQDKTSKKAVYDKVQELAAEFVKRNGALACADLLGLSKGVDPVTGEAVPRRPKKPCAQIVEEAARLWTERQQTDQP